MLNSFYRFLLCFVNNNKDATNIVRNVALLKRYCGMIPVFYRAINTIVQTIIECYRNCNKTRHAFSIMPVTRII